MFRGILNAIPQIWVIEKVLAIFGWVFRPLSNCHLSSNFKCNIHITNVLFLTLFPLIILFVIAQNNQLKKFRKARH